MKISDELEQLLKNLHLKRILEIYEEHASFIFIYIVRPA